MARPRTRIESRFPAVKEAAYDLISFEIRKALNVGEGEAEKRLTRVDDQRGYELPIDVGQEMIGKQSGKITYEPFFGRWFEYGTPTIQAAPFMRPAHRKMKKSLLEGMGANMEPFIRRKAKVRR